MEFVEATNKVEKSRHRKNLKPRKPKGTREIYEILRKNRWPGLPGPMSREEFKDIINAVNEKLAEHYSMGESIPFLARMGKLELRKKEVGARIENGRVVINYPVNWKETLKLWSENPEAKEAKTFVRYENKYVYKTTYTKYGAAYNNEAFFTFSLLRPVRKAIKDNIINGKIDTIW